MKGKLDSHIIKKGLLRYPIKLSERLYSIFLTPIIFLVALIFVGEYFFHVPFIVSGQIDIHTIFLALLATLDRLLIAYVIAMLVSIPLAIFATSSPMAQKIFLPLFDILESVPVLSFFPIIIIFFVKFNLLNEAAIFVIFLSMLWNIVFTAVGGITLIPKDIKAVSVIFNITGFKYIYKVLLPSIFPELVTGSILAFAQGWNIIIIAEVLHVYIPNGTSAQDIFGVGSLLVNSISSGQNGVFAVVLTMMILLIALFNFFIWQKLLHISNRFKFD